MDRLPRSSASRQGGKRLSEEAELLRLIGRRSAQVFEEHGSSLPRACTGGEGGFGTKGRTGQLLGLPVPPASPQCAQGNAEILQRHQLCQNREILSLSKILNYSRLIQCDVSDARKKPKNLEVLSVIGRILPRTLSSPDSPLFSDHV